MSIEHVDVNSVHSQTSLCQQNKTRLVHGDAITRTKGQQLRIALPQTLYIHYTKTYIIMWITILIQLTGRTSYQLQMNQFISPNYMFKIETLGNEPQHILEGLLF